MLKRLLPVFFVIIAALLVFIFTRPNTYHVERSTTLAGPAAPAFALVNDFHHWQAWSPWGKIDPRMTVAYSGTDSGKGAIYHWVGNKDVGEGQMTILESVPNQNIAIKLDFIKPFASTSVATFAFLPAPNGTQVTWSMDGDQSFTTKAISLFMSMDQAVGKDFEKGLAQLKVQTEAAAPAAAPAAADSTHR